MRRMQQEMNIMKKLRKDEDNIFREHINDENGVINTLDSKLNYTADRIQDETSTDKVTIILCILFFLMIKRILLNVREDKFS